MKKGINLLKNRDNLGGESRLGLMVQLGTIILIVVYILIVVGGVFYNTFLAQKDKKVSAKIREKTKGIQRLEKIESLQLVVKRRLKVLKEIFDKEEGSLGVVASTKLLGGLVPDEVEIESIEVSKFGNTLSVRGTTERVAVLMDFFDRLLGDGQEKNNFAQIVLTGLTKNSGQYKFSLSLEASS